MHRRSPILIVGVAALLAVAPKSSADVITFDGFVNGRIMNNQIAGVTISAVNPNRVHDLAAIFDTTLTNTADPDLEGPPWSGGNLADSPFSGDDGGTMLGNVLIIAENDTGSGDGILDNPDDEGSRPGGSLIFNFETALVSVGFDLIDIEGIADEPGSVDFYLNGGLVGTVNFSQFTTPGAFFDPTIEFGNNTANRVSPITAAQLNTTMFDEVRFNLGGSGAIDNIDFTVVPAPGALVLLGMAGLLRRRDRRRRVD